MNGLLVISGIGSPGITVGREVGVKSHHLTNKASALGARAASGTGGGTAETVSAGSMSSRHSYVFPLPVRKLWPISGTEEAVVERKETDEIPADDDVVIQDEEIEEEIEDEEESENGNWVMNILKVGSLWADKTGEKNDKVGGSDREGNDVAAIEDCDRCVGCSGSEECVVGEDEERVVFDRESFSQLLERVPLSDAKLYAKLSYLGNLAYDIRSIKPNDLKHHKLRFVTSSLDKKGKIANDDEGNTIVQDNKLKEEADNAEEVQGQEENGIGISPMAAYRIAASAAAYLQPQTNSFLPFGAAKADVQKDMAGDIGVIDQSGIACPYESSFVATTNSVTAVVAGKEEMKQAMAKDLNTSKSTPCEWYICDDDMNSTRYFIIQGSESLASWQTNLLFEPIQFEGLDVLVHRGIYEAAKGIYMQVLPEIQSHLKTHGDKAKFQFTGHSLGGSLSLLVNLMLLIRNEAPVSSLLPVVTFGAPTIMCGGDYLLVKLGLPKAHLQAIAMHRDIVPRAFSCNYPDHVARILKTVNGNFRNLPCLLNQKLLYSPMGKLVILQPEEKFSPNHHLLPSGSGLYCFSGSTADSGDFSRLVREAKSTFFNSPHPLEILSNRNAFGSEGTIFRDHDMNSYLRALRGVIRQELKHIRKARIEQRRKIWWPLLAVQSINESLVKPQHAKSLNFLQDHFIFAGAVRSGRESLKRFARLVASQRIHMFLVLLFPARLLILGTLSLVTSS